MEEKKPDMGNRENGKAKFSVAALDAGQLDMMWSCLMLGGFRASPADVQCMIESADAVRQMLIQKTGGHHRKTDPAYYVPASEMGTHINLIVVSALALRVSGVLDRLLEIMDREGGG